MKYVIFALLLVASPALADFDTHYIQKPIKLPTVQQYDKAREDLVQSVAKEYCTLPQEAAAPGQIQIRWVWKDGKCVPTYTVVK